MSAFITPFLIPTNRAKPSHNLTKIRSNRVSLTQSRVRCPQMCASTTTKLETFLSAAGDLGTLRFIAISKGAVLETIGRLDYDMKKFTIPDKGDYISIVSVDTTFECHINVSAVKRVTMSSERAKMGDHQLHVIRLFGVEDDVLLSILLQWDPSQGPGNYLHGAVDKFQELRQRFGSNMTL